MTHPKRRERGFILQPTYDVRSGVPVVQLYGRLESGEPFLVEDDRFRPYFHIAERGAALARRARGVRVEDSERRDFAGGALARVEVDVPSRVPDIRDRLRANGIPVFEADVRFAYLYLIDHELRASVVIAGDPEPLKGGLLRFRNPELSAGDFRPRLTVLSIDIETTPDAKQVYSAALYGAGVDEVHIVSREQVRGARHHPTEEVLFWALHKRIRAIDPDVLTGWNVVDFDLRVLARRASELGVPFSIGRSDRPLRFQVDRGFTRQSRVDVPGRQVLDGIGLVRDTTIRVDDYRLETVAQALLGRGKRMRAGVSDPAAEITRLYEQDREAFVAYNREDAVLVADILEQEGLIELTVERSMLTGMQLDRVGASIASFDLVYLPKLRHRARVAPSVDQERKGARLRGGAVLDSHPGLFSNVAVFDFKSLYPSLMRTFNLDPLACAEGALDPDPIVAPNGARFSRQPAILPEILTEFAAQRDAAKQRGDRHADLAIKILMNSFYGVLGAGSCRFFDPDVSNAITGFGQQLLGWTRDAFLELGVQVLYGDTDSVFVAIDAELPRAKALALASSLRERVESSVCKRLADEHRIEPQLDLELELLYDRFFQPTVRGGSQGSKKRYAGFIDGQVRVVGLEAVRRDWPGIGRRLQLEMLGCVFRAEDCTDVLRDCVRAVREQGGELATSELVIRRGLRKGSVDRYTDRAPPHVVAARKAGDPTLRVVYYVQTLHGPEPILPGRPFPSDIDAEYYVEKVLRPIAEAILGHVGSSWEEALGLPRQLSLL